MNIADVTQLNDLSKLNVSKCHLMLSMLYFMYVIIVLIDLHEKLKALSFLNY